MISFKQHLLELFDKAYPYRQMADSKQRKMYTATLPSGNKLKVNMFLRIGEIWDIAFDVVVQGKEAEYNLTGAGEEYKVFSTVIAIIEDFVSKNKPYMFTFSAADSSYKLSSDIENNPKFGGLNRARLYEKMIKRFSAKIKYKVEIDYGPFATEFTFIKN